MKFDLPKGVAATAAILITAGCATYQSATRDSQNAFYAGDFKKAADILEKKSKEEGKDQLLYLLDRGTALQMAGDYKASEKDWLAADRMTDIKDYTSISTELATLFTNETIKQYSGEDFEKVMINAMLSIDYLMQGNFEDALVECRRVNEKLHKYKVDAKRPYEQNPFARYLSAMIWEASGKLEDAYIDYKEAYMVDSSFYYLRSDLTRLAKKLHREDDLKKWRDEFGTVEVLSAREESKLGEVILIYQQGRMAEKRPDPRAPRYPHFYKRYSLTQTARLEVVDDNRVEPSQNVYDVSDIAMKVLNDAYAGMVAKKVAGVVAKVVVADQIAQRNQALGFLAFVGMNAADQADTRQWVTLPGTLQIARLHVPPGERTIRVVGLDGGQQPTGETQVFEHVKVEPGKKVFLNWRSLR